MADTLTPKERSKRMARVHGKDTKPEMRLRRLIHGMGYRYRLHDKSLPGKPDLVFRSKTAVIFMHGCFWHWHEGCRRARMPKSRVSYWQEKISANRRRDREHRENLRSMGWRVLIIWECQLSDLEWTARVVDKFLKREAA